MREPFFFFNAKLQKLTWKQCKSWIGKVYSRSAPDDWASCCYLAAPTTVAGVEFTPASYLS